MEQFTPYGRALFYPYIHFRDVKWLKTAFLYYDGLDRIVPKDYQANDSRLVKTLIDQDFIRSIDPKYQAEQIGDEFLNYVQTELVDLPKREALLKKLGDFRNFGEHFYIHSDKIADELRWELPALGIAFEKQRIDKDLWFEFDPLIGGIYMTFLANSVANNKSLPIISDSPFYQSLLKNFEYESINDQNQSDKILASVVIEAAIPQGIENIPLKKIIEFRKIHADERHLFYHEINKLVTDIKEIKDNQVLYDCINDKVKSINIAVKGLEKAFKGVKINSNKALFGFSFPAVSNLFGIFAFVPTIAVGYNLYKAHKNEYEKISLTSPLSYVLSLKELKSKNLLEQIMSREIIF